MNSRRVAVTFFVTLCLVLCGLVLRRQIAAHPLPPEAEKQQPFQSGQDWHPATASIAREAKATVQGQLDAFRADDGAKAMAYQSRRMRGMSGGPIQFQQMIMTHYPEFGRCRSALFGPIWADQSGGYVNAMVMVEGENGQRAQGRYWLIREDGQLRISDIQIRWMPSKNGTSQKRN